MVRLKDAEYKFIPNSVQFQFHMVRLKVSAATGITINDFRVSIPHGTIKS